MSNTKFDTYTSPEGVSLTLWKFTSYRVIQARARITRLITDEAQDLEGGLGVFATVFSHLDSITFALAEDAPDWLKEFEEWWKSGAQKAFDEQDYPTVWQGYIELESLPVQRILSDAFVKTRRKVLLAPDEIAQGSKAQAEGDTDFLADATPS